MNPAQSGKPILQPPSPLARPTLHAPLASPGRPQIPLAKPSLAQTPVLQERSTYTPGQRDLKGNPKGKISNHTPLENQELKDLLVEVGRVLLMTQIYRIAHPIVQNKLNDLSDNMIRTVNKYGRLVISNREDQLFINGFLENVGAGPLRKLIDTYKFLKVSSFEFEKGVTRQEIASFFSLVVAQKASRKTGNIKEVLQKAGLVHIKPIFLQYIEVDDIPKDVPEPKNVDAEVFKNLKKGSSGGEGGEEQVIADFLQGKVGEVPKKVNSFLLEHPKAAALTILKLIDEYEDQNLDSFSAFQAFVQSISHYMARLSRLIDNPDKVANTLEKLEKHLVVRLKSLKKDRKYVYETRKQISDALSWVAAEQILSHYKLAKESLANEEIIVASAIEKRKVPNLTLFRERLAEIGLFQSTLGVYLKK
ncbi:MAG: hypothetical protein WD231_01455 [Candidatus Woykebacteria bacterium]